MSVHTLIQSAFEEDSSGPPPYNVYPGAPRAGTALPYVTFNIIGGSEEMHLRGSGDAWWKVVQFDAYNKSRKVADNMMAWVRERLLATQLFSVTAIDESAAPRYEEDVEVHRASLEFTIRYP